MKKTLLVLALAAFFASCNQNKKMAKELCECSSNVVAAAMELKEYEASLSEEHLAFVEMPFVLMNSVESFEEKYETDKWGQLYKMHLPEDFDVDRFKEILVINETVEEGDAVINGCFNNLLEKYGEQDPENQQAFVEELRTECPDLLDIANL